MKIQSKIKETFSDELLDLIAAICDTKRIPSLQKKMKTLRDLLYTYDIKFDILGGATNRIALFINGYAIKFALDNQGYRDNLVEYSICEELQPYVTKAYETNGYILVAECVRVMNETDFIARKQDMLNILMTMADDYLLGDVGYIKKNFTNWGIRDNGEIVILDYAYVHRATEKLFTCPVCGEGVLVYDHVFDKLVCTNKSVCHSTFTYNDRKTDQGDQVDLDMIEERKKLSLIIPKGSNGIITVQETKKGKFVTKDGKKVVIVDNDLDYLKMKEAQESMFVKISDTCEAMDALIDIALANKNNDDAAKEVAVQNLDNIVYVSNDDGVEYEVDPDYMSERIGREEDAKITGPYTAEEEEPSELDEEGGLDALIAMANAKRSSAPANTSTNSGNSAKEESSNAYTRYADEYIVLVEPEYEDDEEEAASESLEDDVEENIVLVEPEYEGNEDTMFEEVISLQDKYKKESAENADECQSDETASATDVSPEDADSKEDIPFHKLTEEDWKSMRSIKVVDRVSFFDEVERITKDAENIPDNLRIIAETLRKYRSLSEQSSVVFVTASQPAMEEQEKIGATLGGVEI